MDAAVNLVLEKMGDIVDIGARGIFSRGGQRQIHRRSQDLLWEGCSFFPQKS